MKPSRESITTLCLVVSLLLNVILTAVLYNAAKTIERLGDSGQQEIENRN